MGGVRKEQERQRSKLTSEILRQENDTDRWIFVGERLADLTLWLREEIDAVDALTKRVARLEENRNERL